jgi:hypothetical protein
MLGFTHSAFKKLEFTCPHLKTRQFHCVDSLLNLSPHATSVPASPPCPPVPSNVSCDMAETPSWPAMTTTLVWLPVNLVRSVHLHCAFNSSQSGLWTGRTIPSQGPVETHVRGVTETAYPPTHPAVHTGSWKAEGEIILGPSEALGTRAVHSFWGIPTERAPS